MRITKRVLVSLALTAGLLAGGPAATPLPSGGELRAEDQGSKLMYFRILTADVCYSTCAKDAYCCEKVYLPK